MIPFVVMLSFPHRYQPTSKHSQHAKNKARQFGIERGAVARAVAASDPIRADSEGNQVHTGEDPHGPFEAVQALDEPGFETTMWR